MRHLQQLAAALLIVIVSTIFGCGSSSTNSDTDSSTEESSTVTCSQTNLCKGTYTTNIITGEGSLTGPCSVAHADGGESAKIVFKKSDTCDFEWVKASGDTGVYWLNLISETKNLIIHHKGKDVYLLRGFY